MTFSIILSEKAEDEDLPFLASTIEERVLSAIRTKLAVDPIRFGKPLRHGWQGHRSLRVGDYRIIYRVDVEHKRVLIASIGHRSGVYES